MKLQKSKNKTKRAYLDQYLLRRQLSYRSPRYWSMSWSCAIRCSWWTRETSTAGITDSSPVCFTWRRLIRDCINSKIFLLLRVSRITSFLKNVKWPKGSSRRTSLTSQHGTTEANLCLFFTRKKESKVRTKKARCLTWSPLRKSRRIYHFLSMLSSQTQKIKALGIIMNGWYLCWHQCR